jgi:hypothetical protein
MRIVLCAAMSSLALMMTPIAYAQSTGAPPIAPQQPATYPPQANYGMTPVGAPASTQLNPENCGTPDEPKSCPPMPRRPLNRYPANRQ